MFRKVVLWSILATALVCSSTAFAQTTPTGEQIVQPIIVNGQQAQGVMVIQNGTIQTFTCTSPQPYTTENQTQSGWACFDQTSGTWLLHAQPPQQPTYTYQQPQEYVEPTPIPYYSYYSYPYSYYPYGYYPFGYYSSSRFIVGPRFGFGFGFGYRSPIYVNRPIVRGPVFRGPVTRGPVFRSTVNGRSFAPGPVVRGPVARAPVAPSRSFIQRQSPGRSQSFGGARSFVGFGGRTGGGVSHAGIGRGRR
jgi:hypothetical protein